jgi:thiamine-phosphate pyrophosphorylase
MARLVIVTDRRLVRGVDEIGPRLAAALAAVPPGSVAVQVRDKDLDGAALLALVRTIQALGVPVWVNDRLDVALATGAHGVHLPEAGFALAEARALAPGMRIGCSRHTTADVRAAAEAGADLVQLGPIWPTPAKPDAPLGVGVLAVRAELPPRVALVAVGGIDSQARARAAAAAGADAVAVIRAFWTAPDPAKAAAGLVAAVEAGRVNKAPVNVPGFAGVAKRES